MLGQVYDAGSGLLLPPASLLLIIVLGWLLNRRWPRIGRWVIGAAIGLLYGLSTPLVAGLLQQGLESDRVVRSDEARLAEAIVARCIATATGSSESPIWPPATRIGRPVSCCSCAA